MYLPMPQHTNEWLLLKTHLFYQKSLNFKITNDAVAFSRLHSSIACIYHSDVLLMYYNKLSEK